MNFQTGKHYKTILHCWFLHTHYKFIGHIIIPKPHSSSREVINSHCHRFDCLIFGVFGQSVRPSITAVVPIQRRVAGHSTVTVADRIVKAPLVHSTAKCAKVGFRDSLGMFLRIKQCLGRTETRSCDRIYSQVIRTVRDISRDDRARIATCRLRTPTDRQTDLRRRILLYNR